MTSNKQSTFYIILSNLVIIATAYFQNWSASTVIIIAYMESVLIGIFSSLRIYHLKHFNTDKVYMHGKPVESTDENKRRIARFFAFHYGFFHLVYLIFISFLAEWKDYIWIVINGVVVFISHYLSYRKNYESDMKREVSVGKLFVAPYIRIVPMHIIIIFGFIMDNQNALLLFLGLKTIADVLTHLFEHSSMGFPIRATVNEKEVFRIE